MVSAMLCGVGVARTEGSQPSVEQHHSFRKRKLKGGGETRDLKCRAVNGKQSNNYFRLHTDRCDVISLLSIRKAAKGGTSRVCSAVSVYNEMLRSYPALVPLLFENMDRIWEGENGVYSYPAWCVFASHLPTSLRATRPAAPPGGVQRWQACAHMPRQAAPPAGRHLQLRLPSPRFAHALLSLGRMALALVVYGAGPNTLGVWIYHHRRSTHTPIATLLDVSFTHTPASSIPTDQSFPSPEASHARDPHNTHL